MTFIYLISLIALFLSLVILKKNDKKINVIISIVYSFGILFFYDSFIAFVLSYLNIKNSLLLFSFVYLLTTVVLVFINYKKYKKIKLQKYYLNKKHLIGFLFLIIFCFALGYIKYSGFGEVDYDVTDAAVHFKSASDYGKYLKLFDVGHQTSIYQFDHFMFGYYVPCGLFMQIMPLPNYVCYNIFNTCMLCLLSVCFYVTCLELKKHDKNTIFTVFLTLMYALAYPLNYVLFGFGYLGSGILAFNLVFLTWKFIMKDDREGLYVILTLFNFGIFFSYYLFVPLMYLAEGLYIIFRMVRGEYSLFKMFRYGIMTLLIPAILGFIYFMYKGSVSQGLSSSSNLYSVEGYSYKNMWGNFILLIPMIIYSLIMEFKNKKIDFDIFAFICGVLFIVFTLFLLIFKRISAYYYYKPYYLLWFLVYVFIFKLVNYKEYKTQLRINYSFIVFVILLALFDVNGIMVRKNSIISNSSVASVVSDVYSFNLNKFNDSYRLPKKTLDFLQSMSNYSDKCEISRSDVGIAVAGSYLQRMWFYALTDMVPVSDYGKHLSNEAFRCKFSYEEFVSDDRTKCMLVLSDFDKENKVSDNIDYSNYDVLYETKLGKLVKKK